MASDSAAGPTTHHRGVLIVFEGIDGAEAYRVDGDHGSVVAKADRFVPTLLRAIDSAVERVDRILLHQDSLTNLTNTFLNFRRVSDRAVSTLGQLESLVATNSPSIGSPPVNEDYRTTISPRRASTDCRSSCLHTERRDNRWVAQASRQRTIHHHVRRQAGS